ncbi:hypothetical protein RHMOL_Rhmol08G0134800 [Rhododendron molle]|uniref:Uncharacterized protein n=1 Tax=Rhododendron molle TaxID=49168 RepID=A0ACC0MNB1_RHOML|nr:hypothetical protein RHMOL_Rhmol08G0134800 [Rhododendron molle]
MQECVVFASLLGLDQIIVEGDLLQLVQILENKRACPTETEVVIEDIRCEVGKFRKCDFVFIHRLANEVAYVLANSGL